MVHARDCEVVGTSELSNYSAVEGGCTLRYEHNSLRTNYVSKLTMTYKRDLRVTNDWNSTLRMGNLVRYDLVTTQYTAFLRVRQKKAGVEVSQALALLHSHLKEITAHMPLRLWCTQDPYDRTISQGIALCTVVAFSTPKQGDGLSRTLIKRILRPPNDVAFSLVSNAE